MGAAALLGLVLAADPAVAVSFSEAAPLGPGGARVTLGLRDVQTNPSDRRLQAGLRVGVWHWLELEAAGQAYGWNPSFTSRDAPGPDVPPGAGEVAARWLVHARGFLLSTRARVGYSFETGADGVSDGWVEALLTFPGDGYFVETRQSFGLVGERPLLPGRGPYLVHDRDLTLEEPGLALAYSARYAPSIVLGPVALGVGLETLFAPGSLAAAFDARATLYLARRVAVSVSAETPLAGYEAPLAFFARVQVDPFR